MMPVIKYSVLNKPADTIFSMRSKELLDHLYQAKAALNLCIQGVDTESSTTEQLQQWLQDVIRYSNAAGKEIGVRQSGNVHSGAQLNNAGMSAEDEALYTRCVQLVIERRKASTAMLQRACSIGYARAAKIMTMMEKRDVIGPASDNAAAPREVLIV